MTSRAILFVFHRELELCESRVALLRRLNPGLALYAHFGGRPEEASDARAWASRCQIETTCTRESDPEWKWKNTDLLVLEWFLDRGRRQRFDVLYVIQWDLVLFEPLPALFGAVPTDAVGLSGLTDLELIRDVWE